MTAAVRSRPQQSGIQVDIHARDFRIRPDTGDLQTQTGMAQYGRCRDDWGNWFGGRNLQPSWHCALEDHYLRRNPYLAPPEACIDLMDPPTCAPVFPISQELPRFNELWTLNRFTASCGLDVYRDDLFGPDFAHSYFVCEPAYNLVHRSVLFPKGTTFFSRRAPQEQTSEFLASTDIWFRPVQARTGPDGGLWIVDMYRLIIEHPEYIPERWHSQLDFLAGRGMGRIYRVLAERRRRRDRFVRSAVCRCPTWCDCSTARTDLFAIRSSSCCVERQRTRCMRCGAPARREESSSEVAFVGAVHTRRTRS